MHPGWESWRPRLLSAIIREWSCYWMNNEGFGIWNTKHIEATLKIGLGQTTREQSDYPWIKYSALSWKNLKFGRQYNYYKIDISNKPNLLNWSYKRRTFNPDSYRLAAAPPSGFDSYANLMHSNQVLKVQVWSNQCVLFVTAMRKYIV